MRSQGTPNAAGSFGRTLAPVHSALPRVSNALPPPLLVDAAAGGYEVVFAPLDALGRAMRVAGLTPRRALVVTDATVGALYGDAAEASLAGAGWTPARLTVAPGEASKSVATWARLVDEALALAPDRATPVVALGGGVVGDLAGFLAATLLRGLPLVQVPTTVLAQVDSSVGGKTGVNTAAGKNLVGAFHAPRVVLVDASTLDTLSDREVASGMAEVVKHALLDGGTLLSMLHAHLDGVLRRAPTSPAVLAAPTSRFPVVLREAVAVKARVVSADEREAGARAFLNFGHTFGHALERAGGYGVLTHGEAVAVGMRAALHLSASLAAGRVLPPGCVLPEPFGAMEALAACLPVPPLPPLRADALAEAMAHDKKRGTEGLRFVVLDAPGAPRLVDGVPAAWVEAAWAHVGIG